MTVQILILILGLAMVVAGADALVEGASAIARKYGVSEFVIGLTIVGFGTSLPELVVSVTGALEGNSAIAIGNVVGSNIFNVLLILALSALFHPIAITKTNHHRDIPIVIGATFLVIILGMSKTLFGLGGADGLSRIEGAVLLALFILYIVQCFIADQAEENSGEHSEEGKPRPSWQAVIFIAAGLACLILGGRLFVDSAVNIAHMLHVSDKFIAITVLAMGTSLPELATSIVALVKRRSQMALGNILGSNVFNLLLILGTSAVISPMSFASVNLVDMAALALSALLIFTSIHTAKRNMIDRFDGSLMLAAFVAYMVWLFIKL